MKNIFSRSGATTLLVLASTTYVVVSCGAAPPNSQLHLLGAETERIPVAEAPDGIVSLFSITTTSPDGNSPANTEADESSTDLVAQVSHCYGSYIAKGAVLTAKHCLQLADDEILVAIRVAFSSGHSLSLKPGHPTNPAFTSVLHPTSDLALLIFDAQTLQPPPQTVQLATLPNNKNNNEAKQSPSLYTEATVYGSAGTDNHPYYPNDFYPPLREGTGQIRVARKLYVINPRNPPPRERDYLHRMDLPPDIRYRLVTKYSHPCNRPPAFWDWVLKILRFVCPSNQPLNLLVTAHLRAPDMSLTEPTPRKVLFCNGDSGSGLRDSHGRLLGVISAIPIEVTEHISQDDAHFAFDPIATKKIGCRHIAWATDIHENRSWIEETLRSAKPTR